MTLTILSIDGAQAEADHVHQGVHDQRASITPIYGFDNFANRWRYSKLLIMNTAVSMIKTSASNRKYQLLSIQEIE